MTEEQEVIKYIEKRIKVCNENANICDDNDFDEEATYLREESYMLETVLSMLKGKDKEIDLMAETIRKLAISLASYKGSYNKETINFTGNIKDIKQYFERKATNNG